MEGPSDVLGRLGEDDGAVCATTGMMGGLGGVLFYRMADVEDMKEGERLENGWVVGREGRGKAIYEIRGTSRG